MERVRLRDKSEGGNYFSRPKDKLEFISTGCKTLDLALGGGWAENRISNVVGDKSTGKTLLCIEAAANFALKYKKGMVRYRECEAAFDEDYAGALGMPLDRVDFGNPLETVEDMFDDLDDIIKHSKQPELYILDSLDSLSDRAEMDRDMDQGSYGAEKAKKMSQLFRRLTKRLSESNVTLLIVSQVRDKIGVSFGRKTSRSGGRALDFYASQVLYLAHIGQISKTVRGIKRPVGIKILSKVDKNKVSLPFREAQFQIAFGYGIDDMTACLEFLKEAGALQDVGLKSTSKIKSIVNDMMQASNSEYDDFVADLHDAVEQRWYEIESSFMPKRRKY